MASKSSVLFLLRTVNQISCKTSSFLYSQHHFAMNSLLAATQPQRVAPIEPIIHASRYPSGLQQIGYAQISSQPTIQAKIKRNFEVSLRRGLLDFKIPLPVKLSIFYQQVFQNCILKRDAMKKCKPFLNVIRLINEKRHR